MFHYISLTVSAVAENGNTKSQASHTVSPWCESMAIFQCYSGFCLYCSSRPKYRLLWVSPMMVMFEIKEVRVLLCVEKWGGTFFKVSKYLGKTFLSQHCTRNSSRQLQLLKICKAFSLLVNIYQWKLFLRKSLYQYCFQKPFPNGSTQPHIIRLGHSTFWCGIITY